MEERETDRQTTSRRVNAVRGSKQRGGGEEPYGVAVWEIAGGNGQRAHNRWALREIITESQKVTMNYSNNKFVQPQYAESPLLFVAGPINANNKRRFLA